MFTTDETVAAEPFATDLASLGLIFDHAGVVAPDLSSGRQFFTLALGVREWTEPIEDPSIGVSVQFGRSAGGPAFELIAPLGTGSPVSNALRGNKHILNHLAYRTLSLPLAGEHLRELGCAAVAPPRPAVAYGHRCIQFWITPLRFLIELIEAPAHQHLFELTEPHAAAARRIDHGITDAR